MRDHLILLPGWGLGSAPLEPLRDALHERELNVLIEPLPSLDDAADWLDELDDNLPRDSWLAGWSLGGMLAGELAARRGDDCRGLLTLASNPCFRVREDWPNAMSAETFEDFFEAFLLEPHLTRKRFTLLVSQGARDPRTLARQLRWRCRSWSARRWSPACSCSANWIPGPPWKTSVGRNCICSPKPMRWCRWPPPRPARVAAGRRGLDPGGQPRPAAGMPGRGGRRNPEIPSRG